MYSKRVWLNEENSPSTGSVVAFDGFVRNDKENGEVLSLNYRIAMAR